MGGSYATEEQIYQTGQGWSQSDKEEFWGDWFVQGEDAGGEEAGEAVVMEGRMSKSFGDFCKNATNSQLKGIIQKEHSARRYVDRNVAEAVAASRGLSRSDVLRARKNGPDA